MNCSNTEITEPSSTFLYICNGQSRSCKSFLIFRSHLPYSSVSTISNLTSADATELALINNVSTSATFPTEQEVIIHVPSTINSIIHSQTSATVVCRHLLCDQTIVSDQTSTTAHLFFATIVDQSSDYALCHVSCL
ncbi:hypothetical protein ACFE04_012437 [Oxalis oulophora]